METHIVISMQVMVRVENYETNYIRKSSVFNVIAL